MTIVKICGITNLDDALAAARAGADYLGFILHPDSPRYIAPPKIATIVEAVRQDLAAEQQQSNTASHTAQVEQGQRASAPLRFVGVFVNVHDDQVVEVLEQTGLDYAQLHGDETPDLLARLNGRGYKAIRPQELNQALRLADSFAPLGVTGGPALLIDAYHPTLYGGAGRRGDWQIAAEIAQRVPRLLLAGGLTADNVVIAVQSVRSWGVDVGSGVEATPGRKDHGQVERFISSAKL